MKSGIRMIISAAMLSLVASAGQAQRPPVTLLEGSVETVTENVLFPSSLAGKVQIVDCRGCKSPLWQLDSNTRFNLAGKNVSLSEMAAYAHRARGKSMTIHYRLSDSVVSRVSVLGS